VILSVKFLSFDGFDHFLTLTLEDNHLFGLVLFIL
jgi:hypothetical protein